MYQYFGCACITILESKSDEKNKVRMDKIILTFQCWIRFLQTWSLYGGMST